MGKLLLGAPEFSLLTSRKGLYSKVSWISIADASDFIWIELYCQKYQDLFIIYDKSTNEWKQDQSHSAGFVSGFGSSHGC